MTFQLLVAGLHFVMEIHVGALLFTLCLLCWHYRDGDGYEEIMTMPSGNQQTTKDSLYIYYQRIAQTNPKKTANSMTA